MRVESTVTDSLGGFSLLVDLGSADLTVQTDPATNLPWLVLPQLSPVAGAAPKRSSSPAPSSSAARCSNPQGMPVANAQINAWFPVPNPVDPTLTGAVVKIATTSTDASGAYTLVLPSSI